MEQLFEISSREDYHHALARAATTRAVIATGLSALPGEPIPLRMLAYLLPALTLARACPTSQLEFYWATYYFATLETLETITDLTKKRQDVVRQFITFFFPDVAERTALLRDRMLEPEEALSQILNLLTETVERHATPEMLHFAHKRVNAFRYMASHALYMRDPLSIPNDSSILVNAIQDMETMIMIGGDSEKMFHKIRLLLQEQIGTYDRWRSIQLFTKIGRRSPYYFLPNDVALEDLSQVRSVKDLLIASANPDVRRDLLYLLVFTSGVSDICWFIEHRNALTDEAYAQLTTGWEHLRTCFRI